MRSGRALGRQQTFNVLHTLRSSECSTLARRRDGSADSPAISQAPPVPCRLTGVPAWRATAPSCGDGLARASGDGKREPSIVEQCPARRAVRRADEADRTRRQPRRSERRLERLGRDGFCRAERVGADAHHDCVARAQHAGGVGEHVGPALEHEPDDPERGPAGLHRPRRRARRARPVRRGAASDAAHDRSPATMSARILSVRTRRVVERPAAFADATSRSLASRIGTAVVSSARRSAKRSKSSVICSSVQPLSAPNAAAAAVTASAAAACADAGMCRRSPVSWTTSSRSPGTNAAASASGTDRHTIATEHDRLAGREVLESRAHVRSVRATVDTVTACRRTTACTSASCCRGGISPSVTRWHRRW